MTDTSTPLETGQMAPDFTLPATGWDQPEVTLSALRGRAVVLYFYPRDDTPGCTTEALDFTAALPRLHAAGAEVFGISTDDPASHARFIAKRDLAVPLLSDTDSAVAQAYGAWVEKNMYGRKSMGVERRTVLIDADGRIVRLWPKVKVPGHVDSVVEAVESL
ncbi:peroxiredoxin [Paracoccus sp. p4-l81]|uniref:peroxiredoxin n=1 Tax=Paracoccus sp. p4-l81 TaxID=3342806 RepID=UPI0035B896B7